MKAIYYVFIIVMFTSCKEEPLANFVGTWECRNEVQYFRDDSLVSENVSNDILTINNDQTGAYEDMTNTSLSYSFIWINNEAEQEVFILKEGKSLSGEFEYLLKRRPYQILKEDDDEQHWQCETSEYLQTNNVVRKIKTNWYLKRM